MGSEKHMDFISNQTTKQVSKLNKNSIYVLILSGFSPDNGNQLARLQYGAVDYI